jgi:hypothetical protein
MTITLDLSPEVKSKLEGAAALHGQELRAYLEVVVERMFAPSAASSPNSDSPTDWDALTRIIEKCQFDGADPGLASRFDH